MSGSGQTIFILTFLLGGTIFLSGVVIYFLLKNRSLGLSRFFLAALLLFLALHLGTYLLFTTEMIYAWPHLLGISSPLLLLVGPFFYFFAQFFLQKKYAWQRKNWVHFIPFLAYLILRSPFYLLSAQQKIEVARYYYEEVPQLGFNWAFFIEHNLYVFILLAYVLICLLKIKGVGNLTSPKIKIIQYFSYIFLSLSALILIFQNGILLAGSSGVTAEIILGSILAISTLLMGFKILDFNGVNSISGGKKYQTSALSAIDIQSIRKEIDEALTKNHIFLDNTLKLADLAEHINRPPHQITQVINEAYQTNFYDLINQYRIDQAKKILLSDRINQLSINAIGQECGFNSKASFYRAFRKYTGKTPMEYVKLMG